MGILESGAIGADGRVTGAQPVFAREEPQPNVREFDISADGRFIAYVVAQPDRRTDVFLARISSPSERWLIQEGGTRPRFAADGRLLFLTRGAADAQGRRQGQLVKVTIAPGPTMVIGRPVVVLHDGPASPWITSFDVTPDGRRVLMWKPLPPGQEARYVLVQNGMTRER
jgi:hypothetical protein